MGNCLRGANVWQVVNNRVEYGDALGSGRVGPPFSAENLQELRQWGANFVNVSHPGIYTQSSPYELDKLVQQNLDEFLDKLAAARLYAVISFRTGPGRTEHAFDPPPSTAAANVIWKNKKAQDSWVAMWSKTAARYKNHPAVIGYNLMVEPNSNVTSVNEWDPAVFARKYSGTTYDWYALAKRIIPAIRKVDATTPILVSAMNYGDVGWLMQMPLMPDEKTVYVIHQYEPFLFTHQAPPFANTYPGFFDGNWDDLPETIDKTWLKSLITPARDFRVKNNVPVVVLEYGAKHRVPNASGYLKDELGIFESLELSHAIWLWETDYRGVDWDDFSVSAAADPAYIQALKTNWSKNSQFILP